MNFDIFADLTWRGLIHQTTDEAHLRTWLNEGSRTVYAGFDPTADSLHVGSLMPLLYLRRFQRAGHKPVALVGGATGMIGDPSGKSQERNLLSSEQLDHNLAGIRRQMESFLDFSSANNAVVVNNFDWMSGFSYLHFLRDVGKNFPVNVMLSKDSVKARLESEAGLSYTEFSYMLLQAYDFVTLHDQYGCQLQVGGSDQWGNITAGIDLGRRMRGAQLYGITCPLLTKADGSKMGKTESGTIWLSADRTSPYEFYQYWIRVADEDAGRCLRFLTELSQDEVAALDEARTSAPEKRESQKRLAEELTRLVHGDEGLQIARRATDVFFGAEISELTDNQLSQIFKDVASSQQSRSELDGEGQSLIDALVSTGLAKSKGDARRAITQGGVYINNRRVDSVDRRLTPTDLVGTSTIVLRSGKKNYGLLRF
ncbi:MAG: tyrosine--tRNA ligase [Planctomycetales bacterium]|nr:tyrosine--tRNA ligase [Planctomycetales bacterium]MCA9170462.1 tyrosine--tRNA ligase [Planctomycetales bacterium]